MRFALSYLRFFAVNPPIPKTLNLELLNFEPRVARYLPSRSSVST